MTDDSTTLTMSYKIARRAAEFILREFPPPDDSRPCEIVDEAWADHNSDTQSGILNAIIKTIAEYNGQPVTTEFLAEQATINAWNAVADTPNRTLNGIDITVEDELIAQWRDLTEDAFHDRMMADSSMSAWLEGWEDLAELYWGRPGECGPGCPALLPRQWTFQSLTEAQRFVFDAYIDHGAITPADRRRLAALLPTDETTAA